MSSALMLQGGRFLVAATFRTPQETPGSAIDRYWLFAAGLTHVEVEITVIDTAGDETETYVNPLGTPFQPVLDTAAFDTYP